MRVRVSLFILGLAGSVHAQGNLQGTWKLSGFECSSGAPYRSFGPELTGTMNGTTTFTADEVQMSAKMDVKLSAPYAEQKLKEINQALASARQQPENVERQKVITQLNELLSVVHQYAAGLSCTIKEKRFYTVDGSRLRTSGTVERTSDCPGPIADFDRDPDDATFEIKGDALKTTDVDPETEAGSNCPVGDKETSVFTRIK